MQRRGRLLVPAAVLVAAAIVLLQAQGLLVPQRSGVLALAQILAPHLVLAALLVLVAITLAVRSRTVLLAALLVAVVGLLRFGPGMVGVPAPAIPADAQRLHLWSWNLEATGRGVPSLLQALRTSEADVIGLQELDRASAAAIEADGAVGERYPHRVLRPRDGSTGIGLLSRLPLRDAVWLDEDPSTIRADLLLPDGTAVELVTSHPLPGRLEFLGGLIPIGLDPSRRDAAVSRLRAEFIEPALGSGAPVIVFGDVNTTDREPTWELLTAGLLDAHAEVGWGPGSTWRPPALEWLPFGLLRIDAVLSAGGAVPAAIHADCRPVGSDHCLLRAEMAILSAGTGP